MGNQYKGLTSTASHRKTSVVSHVPNMAVSEKVSENPMFSSCSHENLGHVLRSPMVFRQTGHGISSGAGEGPLFRRLVEHRYCDDPLEDQF